MAGGRRSAVGGRRSAVRRVDGKNAAQRISGLIQFEHHELAALDGVGDDEVRLGDHPLTAHGRSQQGVAIVGREIAMHRDAHVAILAEGPDLAAGPGRQGVAQTAHSNTRMPTLFIPHGAGPCFFMDWNPPDAWNTMADFLKNVANTLPARPSAIVVVSAHWLQPAFSVTSGAQPELFYDYYGFPPHTYELRYPAAGAPQLAARIAGMLGQAQLPAQQDAARGFDHGMFIPAKLMSPTPTSRWCSSRCAKTWTRRRTSMPAARSPRFATKAC